MVNEAVLIVASGGRVLGANQQAKDQLGASEGRRCCDVVAARDHRSRPICTRGCAANLVSGLDEIREGHARVRGQDTFVTCRAVGDHVVVQVRPSPPPVEACATLTRREREVLALIAEGLTSQKIADRLSLSAATIRTHVQNARSKLGARTRTEAVIKAQATGQL